MTKMWTCPFCGGRTRPASFNELNDLLKERVIKEIKGKQNPIVVICTKCKKIWIDEL